MSVDQHPAEIAAWRSAARAMLIARRVAADEPTRRAWGVRIDAHLEGLLRELLEETPFPTVGFCWPYKHEHDARPMVLRLIAAGASAALPVVVAPRSPLAFREWTPGCEMEDGAHGIPVPARGARAAHPDLVLLPMNGFDARGFRLGYGSGYFDRTLASLERRPVVVGICHELGRLETIHPQPHDIPLDYLVTEAGAFRRGREGLAPVLSGDR